MGRKYDFEYIIVGSGPAGTTAAKNLAKAKKRVALIEGRVFGGTNINTRDIPYATALNFSHTYHKVNSLPEFKNQDLGFSLPTAVMHQEKVVAESRKINKKSCEEAGVICLSGHANFIDQHTIAIGSKKLTAANFILATGSRTRTSMIAGTETVDYLTPETAVKIRKLPKVILVVGGGATGCEVATYFAELGTKVIIMEAARRILPREDKEVSAIVSDYLTKRLGAMVLPGYKVVALEKTKATKRVIFKCGNSEKAIRVDTIVLATGSEPRLDYGLENAGVKYNESGIIVNKFFVTSAKNIYAIGDAIGGESSTARSEYEAALLTSNLIHKAKNQASYKGFVREVNTTLGVATVGVNESDLIKRKLKYKKAIVSLNEIMAGKIYHDESGFVKILADPRGRVVGATVVSPNAGLMAEEIATFVRHNLGVLELASVPRSANEYSYAIKLAAKKLLRKK